MKCEYVTEVTARCPVDDRADFYVLTVRSRKMIPCEKILEVSRSFRDQKLFQEDLTAKIQAETGGEVTTAGHHSGVKTTVTAGKP